MERPTRAGPCGLVGRTDNPAFREQRSPSSPESQGPAFEGPNQRVEAAPERIGMQRSICFLLGLALVMGGCAGTRERVLPREDLSNVTIIAHRGASAYAPENTLAAFRLAAEMQADWFELDCQLTADHEVVVMHDDTVTRTTGAEGAVREMTLAELKTLDAGSWKNESFRGEPIPTLEQALRLAKGKIGVYIEIKAAQADQSLEEGLLALASEVSCLPPPLWDEGMRLIEASGTPNLELARRTIALVREQDMATEVVIQSFSPVITFVVLVEAPDLRVEFLGNAGKTPDHWENYLRWGYLMGVAGFNVGRESLTPGRLAAFHAAGKTVAVWTVDEEEEMERFARWDVDGIITNRPDVARKTLSESPPWD